MAPATSPISGVFDEVEAGSELYAKKGKQTQVSEINAHLDTAGTGSTVLLQKQFPTETAWQTLATVLSADMPYDKNIREVEDGVLYRFNCTVFGTGDVNHRLAHQG